MSQAASASFQRTAIDAAGGGETNKKQIKIQILVEPPKRDGLNTVVMSSSAYSQCRFTILVRFTPEGPFPGPTQHEDDVFLQLFTCSALWYRNLKKKSCDRKCNLVYM